MDMYLASACDIVNRLFRISPLYLIPVQFNGGKYFLPAIQLLGIWKTGIHYNKIFTLQNSTGKYFRAEFQELKNGEWLEMFSRVFNSQIGITDFCLGIRNLEILEKQEQREKQMEKLLFSLAKIQRTKHKREASEETREALRQLNRDAREILLAYPDMEVDFINVPTYMLKEGM